MRHRPTAGRALRGPLPTTVASSNWRTTPKPNPRSSSPARAVSTVMSCDGRSTTKLVEQCRLTDSRRPFDEQDASSTGLRFRQRGIDRSEIILAVEKRKLARPAKTFGRVPGSRLCAGLPALRPSSYESTSTVNLIADSHDCAVQFTA